MAEWPSGEPAAGRAPVTAVLRPPGRHQRPRRRAPGNWLVQAIWIFLFVAAGALVATSSASAGAAPAPLRPIESVSFCQTGPDHSTTACRWEEVSLPHRWRPVGDGEGWAVYRVLVEPTSSGPQALLARRLSLSGELHVDGSTYRHTGHPKGVYLRYWPLVLPFATPAAGGLEPLELHLQVRGHAAMKNGLGALEWGDEDAARDAQAGLWFGRVTAQLALAAATALAGVLGLVCTDLRGRSGRMMLCISGLAITAGLRIAMNYVTDPPIGLHAWAAVNVSLLIAVAVWQLAVLGIYVLEDSRRLTRGLAALWGAASLALLTVPSAAVYAVGQAVFIGVTAVALVFYGLLARKALRSPDFVGAMLLVAYGFILLFAMHDLAVHLGSASLSDRYLSVWTLPALLILMTTLMIRHQESQRKLERALQHEISRREDLIRDLHDGLGSRLVALSFHARQSPGQARLADEIGSLITELQIIQHAVRAGPATLDLLLADMRHLYGQVGGGKIPLRWFVGESASKVRLTADQALATVRIFDEAVANALKHANPSAIAIRFRMDPVSEEGELTIENDGGGHFVRRSSGGLRNIELRAARAGLAVRLEERDGIKAAIIVYPGGGRRRRWPGCAEAWRRVLPHFGLTAGHRSPLDSRLP